MSSNKMRINALFIVWKDHKKGEHRKWQWYFFTSSLDFICLNVQNKQTNKKNSLVIAFSWSCHKIFGSKVQLLILSQFWETKCKINCLFIIVIPKQLHIIRFTLSMLKSPADVKTLLSTWRRNLASCCALVYHKNRLIAAL